MGESWRQIVSDMVTSYDHLGGLQGPAEIRELLLTDIQTAYEGDPAALSREEIILSYPCIEAISIQRLAHRLYQSEVPIIPA